MRLLVDAGNSRVKWACGGDDGLQFGPTFATDRGPSVHGVLRQRWGGLPRPRDVYLANVAGEDFERECEAWVREAWSLRIKVLRSGAKGYGISNGYRVPQALGVDRWVAMIGARALCEGPFCLVDCGTAVTIDLVDGEGRHRGGMLAPGLRLTRECLLARIRGLVVGDTPGGSVWGRDTGECLQSGSREMLLGLIDRAMNQGHQALGQAPRLVLTGGDAEIVAEQLQGPVRLVPNLVVQGLDVIWRRDRAT